MSTQKFEGQVALVTGASRGIGSSIALELAQRGLKVIGTATTEEGAGRITSALAAHDGRGHAIDVNDGPEVQALIDEIVRVYGAIHVLVNNAGITRDNLAMRLKDDEWDAVLNTNLKAVFGLSRAVIRPMMKQRYGRIVNITSVVGALGNAGQVNYAAAKAGVAGMTRALARELGSRNITVNCVAPGFMETEMIQALPTYATIKERAIQAQPIKRVGRPGDVADAVAFLASERAGFITGEVLHVTGGRYG